MKFKDDIVAARFDDMCNLARTIAADLDIWFHKEFGQELTLTATTSTLEEDVAIGRLSDTHRTRRAFDIRTKNIDEDWIADLIDYANKKYGKYGAVVSAIPRLIVSKDHGTGPHLHIQLSRKFALKEITYGKS
jgi:hypothetical protein